MKVIMLKDVGKVGQRGKVIEVSDGYALNFLIPQGAAEQATPDKIKAFQAREKVENENRAKEQAKLQATVQSMNNQKIEMKARATEKGGLFKAITAGDIVKSIKEQKGVTISSESVELEKPLKQTGEHILKIRAGGAESQITFVIAAA
ncbi:MAG: ribosomal protein [Candidatus Kaiserbacteria bacterium]|nr:ribosomal protein [Candidatus Kaiserbacteria bacterium]